MTIATRILIAEDERILREMMAYDLEEQGVIVELAENGEEVIKAIEKQKPDLLLLDLLMPKMDGYAVLRHIKDHGYDFPVLMLTNLSDQSEERKCMELGARDFIVKSRLDSGELWEKVAPYAKQLEANHAA